MKKNVKGFIGLFAGIAAFVLIAVALFVPTNPIQDTSIALHGTPNVIMALVAAGLGLVAIVFGILSRKDRDKTGPRKAGVIVGIFAIIIALITAGLCSLTKVIADYANGKPDTAFSQVDNATKQKLDEFVKQVREEFPATK